jgi:hypothetical protein
MVVVGCVCVGGGGRGVDWFGLRVVKGGGVDTINHRRTDLIFDEREEWRHNDGHAGGDDGGELVAQGLAAA